MRGIAAAICLLLAASPASADERREMVSNFEAIRVEGPFRVEVTTGTTVRPAAVARGSARALDGVDIRVEDRTLVIRGSSNGWGGWPGDRIEQAAVSVASPRITALTLSGSGQVRLDRMRGPDATIQMTGSGRVEVAAIEADRLDARLIGSGTLSLGGNAQRASFANSGAGSIDASALKVRDLTVRSESAGDGRFTASHSATVAALGIGAIDVAGGAPCIASGSGPIRCARKD